MSSSLGDFVSLNPWTRAFPLDPTGASSQTILQARSTTLAQILPSYIKPSRSLRSSLQPCNHICTIEGNISRSVSSNASDVWDKLPVHVSSASTPVLYPLLDVFPFQFQFRYWWCISIPFLLSVCNVFPFQFQFQLCKYFSFNFVSQVFPFLYQLLNFLYSFYVE